MECAVCRAMHNDKNEVIGMFVELKDYSTTQMENASELATVVVLEGLGASDGLATIYENGKTRQSWVCCDSLRELARKQAQYDGRNGYIS